MGPIYMNEVKCAGQERSIWNCPFKNITSEDCQHVEDAAVRCNVPYMGYENSVRPEPPHLNVSSCIRAVNLLIISLFITSVRTVSYCIY